MAAPLNRYKADLREIQFLLFEQFHLEELLGKAPYENWDKETTEQVIAEVYRFACDVSGPYNAIGDEEGCKLVDGRVKTPTGFKGAWDKLYAAGWKSLATPEEYGGQGAPRTLQAVGEEFLSGSNTAWNMYSGLTLGAAEVIHEFGTDRQKKLYAHRMFNGQFAGTMCLSEPHAGSDVGAATTTAKKNADGTYSIRGTKCWISAGDHDLAENVVHLALARIEGALPGTKGLSLFIVPATRVNEDGTLGKRNDVKVPSIEHKMGLNGSATCVLEFGEEGECIGEVVGNAEHQGMRQMFLLMNFARIGVGIQGLALASTAYLNALEYARERKQGASMKEFKNPTAPRVAIIEHADVRRMLLDMKSRVEGIRALIYKLSIHQDRAALLEGKDDEAAQYHKGQVDLLTPVVKSYASDQAFRVGETAIQVYGGAGYTRDFPVEQYCRDSKVFSIYEGTNHIQALDLVSRKLGQVGGRNTNAFFGDIAKFIAANKSHAELGASIQGLERAHEAVTGSAMQLLTWFQMGQAERLPLVANRFLEMMSLLVVSWLLLDGAVVAVDKAGKLPEGHADCVFYMGKKHAAIYYAQNVLPAAIELGKSIASGDKSALDIPNESFATV
ncbi:MAG: acyl-CoA dehydrogenase [Sandaracinaceae bacterium]|nr:acyl-CoA dehydrogenase [Sandaracinaceae bacterium]